MPFAFSDNEKFSFIAVDNCFTDLDSEVQLPDGTWILTKLPIKVDDWWVREIGRSRTERLTRANLIILRRLDSQNPEILDGEHLELFERVLDIFWVLQLSGIAEYDDASAIQGSFEAGTPNLRQMIQLDHYYQTTNAPRTTVTIQRFEEASEMATTWRDLVVGGKCDRFVRGAVVLRSGLEARFGQERASTSFG